MISNKLDKESLEDINVDELAVKLKKLGEKPLPQYLLDEALKSAEDISLAENKTRVLSEMAVNLFSSEFNGLGKEIYNKILKTSKDIKEKSDRAKTLADIGKTFFDIDIELSEELFDRLLETSRMITDDVERVNSMTHIAENKVKIGLKEEGESICEEIYETALNLAEKKHEILPLVNVAKILAESGSVQRSIDICEKCKELSEKLSNNNERCWDLGNIAIVYTKAEKIEKALTIAESICSEDEGDIAIGEMMISLTEVGETERALDLHRCITNKGLTYSILADIGSRLATGYRIDEAEYVKGLIEDPEEQEWVTKEIAVCKASEGEIKEAINMAETLFDIDVKILTLTMIAKSLIRSGEENKLGGMIKFILKLSEDSISDSVEVNIVEILADTGFIDLAIDRARNIETSEEKAIALSYISAESEGITVLSQDFLNTLESIQNPPSFKSDNRIKDIALKLTENKSRKEIAESIDSLHDEIDKRDI